MKPIIIDPATMLNFGPGTLPRWVLVVRIACVVTVLAVALGGQLMSTSSMERARQQPHLDAGRRRLARDARDRIAASTFAHVAAGSRRRPLALDSRRTRRARLVHLEVGVTAARRHERRPRVRGGLSARDRVGRRDDRVRVVLDLVARKGDWAHGFAMFALAELLLLGLWLPLSASITSAGAPSDWWFTDAPLLPHPIRSALLVVIPPTLVAAWFTALSLRRRARPRRSTQGRALGPAGARCPRAPRRLAALDGRVLELRPGAARSRARRDHRCRRARAVHARQRLPAASHARAHRHHRRRSRRRRRARVRHRDPELAARAAARPAPVRDRDPDRPIPVTGAVLIAPLPDSTTLLGRTEMLGLVNPGQTVTVYGGGYDTGGPFRASSALLSGSIYVAPAGIEGAQLSVRVLRVAAVRRVSADRHCGRAARARRCSGVGEYLVAPPHGR